MKRNLIVLAILSAFTAAATASPNFTEIARSAQFDVAKKGGGKKKAPKAPKTPKKAKAS